MNLRKRFRQWRYRRRWKRAERRQREPLREFAYLDEVSVYSLVASQVGLIVTELTETQATSLQTDVASSAGVTAGFAKAEFGSRVQAGEMQTSQVLRKAIVQTTFKQMYDSAVDSLALGPVRDGPTTPPFRTVADVEQEATENPDSTWVIHPTRLQRGDLVELEVQLEAEPIFHAGAVMSSVLEIVQDDPAAFGLRNLSELAQARFASRMIHKLMAGLVPLRGQAIDYLAIEIRGAESLVHKAVLDQLQEKPNSVRPVYLVGVAEQGLFWKDARRVLFSGSSYRVLARLRRDGVQTSWTPVKLVDVLRDVLPDVADMMDRMNRGVLSAMSTAVAEGKSGFHSRQARDALVIYTTLLADRVGIAISEEDLEEAGLLEISGVEGEVSIRDWRRIVAPATSLVQARSGQEIDRAVAADCRIAALNHAGLISPAPLSGDVFDLGQPSPDERFLDSEIVAVYW